MNSKTITFGIIIIWQSIIALAIFKSLAVAWVLAIAPLGLVFLQAPTYAWVSASFLSVVLSRVIVATGFIPAIFNFVHFPIALGAAIVASARGDSDSQIASFMRNGIVAFLLLSMLSWIINGGEFIRPLFTWLVFCEPFLLVYALLRDPPTSKVASNMWILALGIAFIQLPLGIWHAFSLGWGDYVQGTFVGMGAGHHVSGGVALVGALICMARSLQKGSMRMSLWIAGMTMLCVVPILSDAKHVFIAFIPALAVVIYSSSRGNPAKLLLPVLASIMILYLAFSYYKPFQNVGNRMYVSRGFSMGKVKTAALIASKMSETPESWILGLGPGNTISRVATLSTGGIVRKDSPVGLLGLKLHPITIELFALYQSDWQCATSSIWGGVSSYLGLWGDLGLIGIALYLWIGWKLWCMIKLVQCWETRAARGLLVMTGFLGAFFNWLENPGFMLMVAFIIGIALVKVQEDVYIQGDRGM